MATGLKNKNARSPGHGSKIRHRAHAADPKEKDADLERLLVGLQRLYDGDFSARLRLPESGRAKRVAQIFNALARQNQRLARECAQAASLVGRAGPIAQRAPLKDLQGAWATIIAAQNSTADDLNQAIVEISRVIHAVTNGDLSQSVACDLGGRSMRGGLERLGQAVNTMVDELRSFVTEVTRVAKEGGVGGKFGPQTRVTGVSGTWKDLTEHVNQLTGHLTSQVHAIAEVFTAVTSGDLTRPVTVEAEGDVQALKDRINQMIKNLQETAQKNTEQDWLKTHLARFSAMMQGQKNLLAICRLIMSELTPLVSAQHGAFYIVNPDANRLDLIASYAPQTNAAVPTSLAFGEGIVGQCALEKRPMGLDRVLHDHVPIASGLGYAAPAHILANPVLFEKDVLAVIELVSFQPFNSIHRVFLDQLMVTLGVVLNTIGASMRTEKLLEELQNSNGELETQANELEEKATLLEIKNQELEMASLSLEEKAKQLAMISKYKSEFLANMSHELRTPLNSLLIMAKLLAENRNSNLNSKQIQFADTIYASGRDLLNLINEILDLSKVEAGKMSIVASDIKVAELVDYVVRDFRAIAQQKDIAFVVKIAEDLPESLFTDGQRLQQVLKNLLSNAFKFTERGAITLEAYRYKGSRTLFHTDALREPAVVVGFTVHDSGIGIAFDKQGLIFEAFQQVDATTSRKYGGTGLGLTISREISRLLGGEIHLRSLEGKGSQFTLYIPQVYVGQETESQSRERRVAPLDDDTDSDSCGKAESGTGAIVFSGQKVLVVDDDVRNIFAIASVLENYKLNVLFAESGTGAMEILEKNSDIAIVFMDIMMPGMDGYETARAVRRMERYKAVPIIALTAKAMKRDRESALAAGLSGHIAKPVDTDTLLGTVRFWLKDCAM
ncbi:response regulator [Acidiferrobacter sp.]|uniref:response regulator n=1 Tax=Acidiferrobacter sp. TaxID=1872107 RepID=UPI002612717A|nr:response regulator [Acidiferrobacter sp.]